MTVGDIEKQQIKQALGELRQKRYKSPILWAAIVPWIVYGILKYFGVDFGNADLIVELVLAALTALGVINNPTDAEKI
ncbi:hypothetical protein AGMMS49975_26550 [Clostridia bacterium]|nr:hypothetical protein AGMMS49975_26550 [Clostridia bacterium]